MKAKARYLWTAAAAAGMFLCGSAAWAQTVSVAFAPGGALTVYTSGGTMASNAMLPADVAGVVPAANWNNANSGTVSGVTLSGTVSSLKDSSGNSTGVNVAFVGSTATNSPRLVTGGTTGDEKMMSYSMDTNNQANNQGWPTISVPSPLAGLNAQGFAPTSVTAEFTNLNAEFPNGYDVYVYVKGTSPGFNQATGAGYVSAQSVNAAAPVALYAGGSGMNAFIQNSGTPLQFGNNGPAAQSAGGVSADDPSTVSAHNYQRAIIWPTDINSGSGSSTMATAEFNGTYATSPSAIGAVDTMPLDWLSLSGLSNPGDPVAGQDYPSYNSGTVSNNWLSYVVAGGPAYFSPTDRGIPVGNYVKFSNLSLDTLDILARNLAGMRNSGGGSSSYISEGGISGIQIVATPVPEPTTLFLLAGFGLVGLARFGWRRRARS